MAYLSDNLLAKRINEKCTQKHVKWSTNYPMSSSENDEQSELKWDQISSNIHVWFWVNAYEQISKINLV